MYKAPLLFIVTFILGLIIWPLSGEGLEKEEVAATPALSGPSVAMPPASKKSPLKLPPMDCSQDWAGPLGGTGFFSQDSKNYYHFGQMAPLSPQAGVKAPLLSYGVFKIALSSLQSQLLLTLKLPKTSAFMPQGEPLQGVAAFMYTQASNSCLSGPAKFIALPIKKLPSHKHLPLMHGTASIQFVASPQLFPLFFDTVKQQVVEMDFASLQLRSSFLPMLPREVPVYIDLFRHRYYSWHFFDEQQQRGLVAYEGGGKIAGRLSYLAGDKLLQQNKFFGMAQFIQDKNLIYLIEIARWSGGQTNKTFTLPLPPHTQAGDSALKVHFQNKLAVLAGKDDKIRKLWRKVYIYDYEKSWQLSYFKAPEDLYPAYEEISPNGNWVAVELRHVSTEVTSQIAIFSIPARKWTNLPLLAKR